MPREQGIFALRFLHRCFASRLAPGQSLLDDGRASTYKFFTDALIQKNRVVTRQGANLFYANASAVPTSFCLILTCWERAP